MKEGIMRKNPEGYYTNRHSCFLLQYHLVLVTKYRKPVITEEIKEWLINYTKEYFKKQDCILIEVNTQPDHIHILFEAPPQINLANFVNAFKSASSRMIRNLFQEQVSRFYWKPYFWSLSYFLCTVSERTAEAVMKYIQNQDNNE